MFRNKFFLLLSFFIFLTIGSYFGTKYHFNTKETNYWKNWNNTLEEKNLIITSLHEIGHVVMNLEISEYQNKAFATKFEYELKKVTIVPNKKRSYLGLTTGNFLCTGSTNICIEKKKFWLPFLSVKVLKQYLHAQLAGNKTSEIFLKNKNTTNLNYHKNFLNYQSQNQNSDIYNARKTTKIISQKTKKSIKGILEEEYQNLEKILLTKEKIVLLLSEVLLKQKTLTKAEIDIVIKNLNSPKNLSNYDLYRQTWDWDIFAPYKENKLEFWKTFSLAVFFIMVFLTLVIFISALLKSRK